MIYPDTLEAAAERCADRIEHGADELAAPPEHYDENEEQRAFREAASAGARAYAAALRHRLETEPVTESLLEEADLVDTASHCAGWLGTSGSVIGRDDQIAALQEAGFFVFHPARPGEYVACYRLVAPC